MPPLRHWLVVCVILLAGCGSKPKLVTLPPPTPARLGNGEEGMASWYGHPYHGRRTSNGEIYDMDLLTAAHLSLPFDTWVRVTNLENGRWIDVRINDRGPFVKNRIIDLSRAAAQSIRMIGPGTTRVQVEVVGVPGQPYPPVLAAAAAMTPVSYSPSPSAAAGMVSASGMTAGNTASTGVEDPAAVGSGGARHGLQCPGPFYAVQVGSFRDSDNAERMRGKMSELYGVSRMIEAQTGNGKLFRVVVGQTADRDAAQRLLEHIGRDRFEGYVLRVDPTTAQCL
ncbi:MAG: septal ring lytic transglycosylase RlpA family protein [Bryobacterales bacterium]